MRLHSVSIHGVCSGCKGRCTHCVNRLDVFPHTVATYLTEHGTESVIKTCMFCVQDRPLYEYERVYGSTFTQKLVEEIDRFWELANADSQDADA